MTVETLFATQEETGLRLDRFLAQRFPEQSRTYFQYLIGEGLVLINGKPSKKRITLAPGDEIEVAFALTPELTLQPQDIPLKILYEDEHLLAIDKPAGMVVHPGAGNWENTFVNALLFHCKNLEREAGSLRPGIVHRLDKDTTGVLLAAKTHEAQQKLVAAFAERSVYKEYLALCTGTPLQKGKIDAPIGRDPKDRKKMCVISGGKAAVTDYITLARSGELALLAASPKTGRTHQIRVHLSHLKTPILGDTIYGSPTVNRRRGAKRPLLHAHRLRLTHPITGAPLELHAPPPEDFIGFALPVLEHSGQPNNILENLPPYLFDPD